MGDSCVSRRILVAEDDAAIASLAREVLREAGYLVDVAATHAAALAVLATTRYALILTDTGEVLRAADEPAHWRSVETMRAAASGAPVVLFSAHAPSDFHGYRERGFAGLVSKPFDLETLVATVGALVTPR
jgi:CheY-like chemotaxis protein